MSALFGKAKDKFLSGTCSWTNDTIKAVLVSAGYTVDLVNHEFLSDIPSGARVATSAELGGKTVSGGAADAGDFWFTAVQGAQCPYLVTFRDTGSAATSDLISFHDSATAGLPLTPNGGDVLVKIDNGADKLFRL